MLPSTCCQQIVGCHGCVHDSWGQPYGLVLVAPVVTSAYSTRVVAGRLLQTIACFGDGSMCSSAAGTLGWELLDVPWQLCAEVILQVCWQHPWPAAVAQLCCADAGLACAVLMQAWHANLAAAKTLPRGDGSQ